MPHYQELVSHHITNNKHEQLKRKTTEYEYFKGIERKQLEAHSQPGGLQRTSDAVRATLYPLNFNVDAINLIDVIPQ